MKQKMIWKNWAAKEINADAYIQHIIPSASVHFFGNVNQFITFKLTFTMKRGLINFLNFLNTRITIDTHPNFHYFFNHYLLTISTAYVEVQEGK